MSFVSAVRSREAGTATGMALAWRRYLTAVRDAAPESYEEVEARAWERLREELSRLGPPLCAAAAVPAGEEEES